MDALWPNIAATVARPVYGDLLEELDDARGLNGLFGLSLVDKDLRTLLGERVRGEFNLRYCGAGSLGACRASLWATVDAVARVLVAVHGPDPAVWRSTASRTRFQPGLIPDTIRTTNRPTFQQVIELAGKRAKQR
jgi:hypothetical protein